MEEPRQLDILRDGVAERPAEFRRYGEELPRRDYETVQNALAILERSLREPGIARNSPETVADYLKCNIALRPHEVFVVLLLNNQHRLIESQKIFHGTIDATFVYPREVVKEALRLNAAAVILAHNYSSGLPKPSHAARNITRKLKEALKLVDIRVLDHVIVASMSHTSFANRGLMPRSSAGTEGRAHPCAFRG